MEYLNKTQNQSFVVFSHELALSFLMFYIDWLLLENYIYIIYSYMLYVISSMLNNILYIHIHVWFSIVVLQYSIYLKALTISVKTDKSLRTFFVAIPKDILTEKSQSYSSLGNLFFCSLLTLSEYIWVLPMCRSINNSIKNHRTTAEPFIFYLHEEKDKAYSEILAWAIRPEA